MDIQKIVGDLKKEREQLDRAITALEGIHSAPGASNGRAASKQVASTQVASTNGTRRGRLTAEGRKRLSEAMKRRWAERRKRG